MTWCEASEARRAAEVDCEAIQAALSEALWRLELARAREYRAELDWDGSAETAPKNKC